MTEKITILAANYNSIKYAKRYNGNNNFIQNISSAFYTQVGISCEVIDQFDKLVKTRLNNNKIQEGDVIYFTSLSSIPRYKFSTLCKSKNLFRCNSIEKATKIAIGDSNSLTKLISSYRNAYHRVPITDFERILNIKVPQNDVTIGKTEIHIPAWCVNAINNGSTDAELKKFPRITILHHYSDREFKIIEETNNILNDESKLDSLITDECLNDLMSEELLAADDEILESIGKMLEATDVKDVAMGMEMLANVNYKPKLIEVAFLLHKNYLNIAGNPAINLVNFKSFLNNFKDLSWNAGDEVFLISLFKFLKSKNILNEELKGILKEKLICYLNLPHKTKHRGYKILDVSLESKDLITDAED